MHYAETSETVSSAKCRDQLQPLAGVLGKGRIWLGQGQFGARDSSCNIEECGRIVKELFLHLHSFKIMLLYRALYLHKKKRGALPIRFFLVPVLRYEQKGFHALYSEHEKKNRDTSSCVTELNESLFTESQNNRMVGVGRDLCGSSSPTLLPKQGHLQ